MGRTQVFFLTEWSVLPALIRALRGGDVRIAAVEAAIAPLQRVLERIAAWINDRSRTRHGWGEIAAMAALRRDVHIPVREGAYMTLESWQFATYDYEGRAARLGADGYPFKKVCNAFCHRRYGSLYALKYHRDALPDAAFHGIDADLATAFQALFGQPLPDHQRTRPSLARYLANALIALLMALAGLALILARTRRSLTPQPFFLGVDWMADYRDEQLFAAIQQAGHSVLYVPRKNGILKDFRTLIGSRVWAMPSAGRFTWQSARSALAEAASALGTLFMVCGRLHPRLFYDLAALPIKRMLIRGFLQRYPCQVFWGRDEYNVEHILRTQEMERMGGRSVGVFHGIPINSDPLPWLRFISLHSVYAFGNFISGIYPDSWAKGTRLVPIGGFGFSRAQYPRARKESKDIVAFVNPTVPTSVWERMFELLDTMSTDRRIIYHLKPSMRGRDDMVALHAWLRQRYPHFVENRLGPYDVMAEVGFAISDPSTIVAECVQFCVPTMVLDNPSQWRTLIYRQFPDLCFDSPEGVLQRLRVLDKDPAAFRRDLYASLVSLSLENWMDIVMADMGLHPSADRGLSS
jgi:hypothetical protein